MPAWRDTLAVMLLTTCSPMASTPGQVVEPMPDALSKMADTERAFARRAKETTIREAFIEFFADEAVGFEPDPTPARESLKKNTRPQPAGFQLLWEPRLGDVAASGDLGFLTGPAEFINVGKPTGYGNYFSVWKRQANGEYRVILDVGASAPAKPEFAPGFTRARTLATWSGHEPKAAAEASLLAADRALSDALGSGVSAAYRAAMHPQVRFMRTGVQPMTTREEAVAWLGTAIASMTTDPMKAETGASGELGYTWGKQAVTLTSGAAHSGYCIRIWTRQAGGTWLIAADIATPPPAAERQ
jgi:ketosteroid isomerase-like protein